MQGGKEVKSEAYPLGYVAAMSDAANVTDGPLSANQHDFRHHPDI